MAGYDPIGSIMNTLRRSNSIDPAQQQQRQSRMGMLSQQQGAVQGPVGNKPTPQQTQRGRAQQGMPPQGRPAQPAREEGQEGTIGVQGGDFTPIIIDQMNETILSLKVQIHREKDPSRRAALEQQTEQIRQNVIALGGEPIWADESVEEGLKKIQGHGAVGYETLMTDGGASTYPPRDELDAALKVVGAENATEMPAVGAPPPAVTPTTPTTPTAATTTTPIDSTATIKPTTTTSTLLQRGSTGTGVTTLQQQLQALGYYTGSIDGIYGPETERAVRTMQAAAGITVDGIAGPQTMAAFATLTAQKQTTAMPTGGTTFVEGSNTYTNVNGQIYKNGVLVPPENYKWIPSAIGGTRDGPSTFGVKTVEDIVKIITEDGTKGTGTEVVVTEEEEKKIATTAFTVVTELNEALGINYYSQEEIQDIARDLVARQKLVKEQAILNEIARFQEKHDHEFARASEEIMSAANELKADERENMIARGFYYSSSMANNMAKIDESVMKHLTDIAMEAALYVNSLQRELTDLEQWAIVEQIALERELTAIDRADRTALRDLIISTQLEYDKLALDKWYKETITGLEERSVQIEEMRFDWDKYQAEGQYAAQALMYKNPLISGQLSQLGLTQAEWDKLDPVTQAGIVGNLLQFLEIDAQLKYTEAQKQAITAGVNIDKEMMSLRWSQFGLDSNKFAFEQEMAEKYAEGSISEADKSFVMSVSGVTQELINQVRVAKGETNKTKRMEALGQLKEDANLVFNAYLSMVESPEAKQAISDMRTMFNDAVVKGDAENAEAAMGWFKEIVSTVQGWNLPSPSTWSNIWNSIKDFVPTWWKTTVEKFGSKSAWTFGG